VFKIPFKHENLKDNRLKGITYTHTYNCK